MLAFSDVESVQSLRQLRNHHPVTEVEIVAVYTSDTEAGKLGRFLSDHLTTHRVAQRSRIRMDNLLRGGRYWI